jgi:hypothetical protein
VPSRTINYRSSLGWKPSRAQQRVLVKFEQLGRQLPAQPHHWTPADRLAIQALVRRGYLRLVTGRPEPWLLRTYKRLPKTS